MVSFGRYAILVLTMCIFKTVDGIFLKNSTGSVHLQQCISHCIPKVFNDTSLVYFLRNCGETYSFADNLPIPHISIDIMKPVLYNPFGYGRNFFIEATNVSSLFTLLDALKKSSVWNIGESAMGKFAIVVFSEFNSSVFQKLWNLSIIDALVIAESDGEYKAFTSDPFYQNNKCGTKVEEYKIEKCSPHFSLNFSKPIRDHNGCSISFYKRPTEPTLDNTSLVFSRYLQRALNMKASQIINNYNRSSGALFLAFSFYETPENLDSSYEIVHDHFVWVSPSAVNISLFVDSTFQFEVWVMVILVFIMTILTWWLIPKFSKSTQKVTLGEAFIITCSLTCWGSVNKAPTLRKLRMVFLLCAFYTVIIQTGFTANILSVLTSTPDINKINNVKDVANSRLEVCTEALYKDRFFFKNLSNDDVYTKIKNKIKVVNNHTISLSSRNCIVLLINMHFMSSVVGTEVRESIVTESTYAWSGGLRFHFHFPHHLMRSVNAVIERWKETGVSQFDLEKIWKDQRQSSQREDNEPVALRLEHFAGAFAMWGICLLICLIVFILEIVIYKIKN